MLNSLKQKVKTLPLTFLTNEFMQVESVDEIKDIYGHGVFSLLDFCIVFGLSVKTLLENGVNPNLTDCLKFLEDENEIDLLLKYGLQHTSFPFYYVDFKTKEFKVRDTNIVKKLLSISTPSNDMILRAYKLKNDDRENLMKLLKSYEYPEIFRDLMSPFQIDGENIIVSGIHYRFDEFIEKFYPGYGIYLENFINSR